MDALCQSEAFAAGYAGTFKALITTDTQPASSRFTFAPDTAWYRSDHAFWTRGAELLQLGGATYSALNFAATGEAVVQDYVWTGGDPARVTGVETCTAWTDGSATGFGTGGAVGAADVNAFGGASFRCDRAQPVYCLED
jgi:hypothetical protein